MLHIIQSIFLTMHVRFYFLNRISLFPKYREIHVFSQDSYIPHPFNQNDIRYPLLTSHLVFLAFINPTPTLVCFLPKSTSTSASYFVHLSYPALPIYPPKMTLNPFNRRRTYLRSTSSREFEECPTKRWTILEGNAARVKTGNLFRETKCVFFYFINVNLPSH